MRFRYFLPLLLLLAAVACQQAEPVPTPDQSIYSELLATAEPVNDVVEAEVVAETALTRPYGYTYHRPDGNRSVRGLGIVPTLSPLDIPLDGQPQWITAVPLAKGVLWGVMLEDGRTQTFLVDAGEVTPVDSNELTPDSVPVMTVDPLQGQAIFLNPPLDDPDGRNPIIYNEAGHLAISNPDGQLFLVNAGEILAQPEVTLLPDARLLFDEAGRLLFLTDPTDRYPHGVLGDRLEAGSITLLETDPEVSVALEYAVPEPQVIEGIMPLWVDWDEDGEREIVVTVSDAEQGAQIHLVSESGRLLAKGPAIGSGNRWRHQLAIAPFGPEGALELVDVRTPHLGGSVEFYQWVEDELQIVASVAGYTSHVLGSNNLDMGLAGDFNGDGRAELLLPTQDRRQLGGIQRTEDGAEVIYQIDPGGQVITNVAGATMSAEETAVGVGTDSNTLRIWQP